MTRPRTRAVDIEICSAEFLSKHPEMYHYTTRAGLEGLITTRTIWATHYRRLNDSTEIQHFRRVFAEALAPRFDSVIRQRNLTTEQLELYTHSGGPRKLASDFVTSLYAATFDQKVAYGPVDAFVASFCTHAADQSYEQKNGLLSQWRGYSGGDGYCLVFDSGALANLLADEFDRLYWLHMSIGEVSYDGEGVSVAAVFPKLFSACASNLEEFLRGDATPELNTAADFWESASRFKHRGFFEEREVRIVAIPGSSELAEHTKREHPEFQEKPLPDVRPRPERGPLRIALFEGQDIILPIKRVIVGPARSREEMAEKVRFARNLVGDSVQVDCSNTPWIPPAGVASPAKPATIPNRCSLGALFRCVLGRF